MKRGINHVHLGRVPDVAAPNGLTRNLTVSCAEKNQNPNPNPKNYERHELGTQAIPKTCKRDTSRDELDSIGLPTKTK
jgi:hypothetical protein